MEDHEYVLISRTGEAISCVDNVPDEMTKLNCKTLILRLPGLLGGEAAVAQLEDGSTVPIRAADVEIEFPEGFYPKLVRRTIISVAVDGDSNKGMDREWKFVVSVVPLKQERCESGVHAPS